MNPPTQPCGWHMEMVWPFWTGNEALYVVSSVTLSSKVLWKGGHDCRLISLFMHYRVFQPFCKNIWDWIHVIIVVIRSTFQFSVAWVSRGGNSPAYNVMLFALAHVLLSWDHVFSTPMDISMLCVTCATSAGPAVWPIPTVTENSDAALVEVVSDVPVVRATPTISRRGCS